MPRWAKAAVATGLALIASGCSLSRTSPVTSSGPGSAPPSVSRAEAQSTPAAGTTSQPRQTAATVDAAPQTPTATQAAVMELIRPTAPVPGHQYFGVQLDWSADTPAAYAARLGRVPYDFGDFASIPFTPSLLSQLDSYVDEIAGYHAKLFLTIEIPGGLGTVTPAVAQNLASNLERWNLQGVGVFLRFGQEMNGSWYPWGQQPAAYVNAFRLVATYLHRYALGTVMVWSPNYGGGYPFPGETYQAQPGTAAFAQMDTDHDGRITMADDPYGPYYPGDSYVDWVGLTLYHFGNAWPWGSNDVPEARKFVDQITGRYSGDNGNDTAVPDFYQAYAVGHHKPMAISETAALYDEANTGTGASEAAVKDDWISQVFNPAVPSQFPGLAMVNWFEHQKPENGITGVIDWRATINPTVREHLQAALRDGHYILLPPERNT
jgi:hypothetical protein